MRARTSTWWAWVWTAPALVVLAMVPPYAAGLVLRDHATPPPPLRATPAPSAPVCAGTIAARVALAVAASAE